MMSKEWIQFLLVAVPILSLIGSWLALRGIADRIARREQASRMEFDKAGLE